MTGSKVFEELWTVICDRAENPPEKSYVADILNHRKGVDKSLEKVGEEAVEFIIAAKNSEYEAKVGEAADLIFHTFLAMRAAGIELSDVMAELESRRR
ncbi:MAG: phosphoribosyl-ATP diphosphatase [Methanomicrobiaceae archaeon]|nr:phosphoribosyl-ATP diphosphatase [Methanomicrobiaceae archaeon]